MEQPQASGLQTGRVKWYDDHKGYGFITIDDTTIEATAKSDVWVHRDDIAGRIKSLAKGEHVEFFIRIDEQNRPKAVNVTGPGNKPVKGSKEYHEELKQKIPDPLNIDEYDQNKIYTGRVKWYNLYRGFGYVIINDTKAEVYVHRDDIIAPNRKYKSLKAHEPVQFKVKLDNTQRCPFVCLCFKNTNSVSFLCHICSRKKF